MTDFKDLWKEQYNAELDRKEKINTNAQFTANMIALQITGIFFLLSSSNSRELYLEFAFYAFIIISFILSIISAALVLSGFDNTRTMYIDAPTTQEKYFNSLKEHDEANSSANFEAFLLDRYRVIATTNGERNDRRSTIFHWARASLIASIVLFSISATIYMSTMIRWSALNVCDRIQ